MSNPQHNPQSEIRSQQSGEIRSQQSDHDPNPKNSPPASPEQHIIRVQHHLRQVNEKAYDPVILAIGPYHHENDMLKSMEEPKKRYKTQWLERKNKGSVNWDESALKKLGQEARNCYGSIELSPEEFLEMMLVDGCFIIKLFLKYSKKEQIDQDEPIMHRRGIRTSIRRDLLLLENQLPLSFLSNLYELTKGPDHPNQFSDVATRYFSFEPGGPSGDWSIDGRQGEHLLHLYHMWRTSGLPQKLLPTELDCRQRLCCIPKRDSSPEIEIDRIRVMPSATELSESGVSFRAARGRKLSDIKFGRGTLEIPALLVHDNTESQFRNLIAYEQHRHQRSNINYFTDYVAFMDSLINSSKDVKVLRRAGIIKNYLGDDEVVAQIFSKIGDHVTISKSYYSEIFKNVNAYCDNPWNIWMAKLSRDYFHSPWAFLSVLAATMLLLLTIAQTIFSILSYTKQS